MKDILSATDLTPAADIALHFALRIADRSTSQVTLLHVVEEGQATGPDGLNHLGRLDDQVQRMNGTERVRKLLLEGNFMTRIAEESERDHALVVIGTHGPRGIRQTLFGADILKLVRRMARPSLVVQETTPTENTFDRIVMPVAGHTDIDGLVAAVAMLARLHTSEVHIYQLVRPNEEPSPQLIANKQRMMASLTEAQVRCVEVQEPPTHFSIGFAEPTIRYAERIGAGCIAMMAHASNDHRYIADAEKERLLTNDASIPVLCA
jgi:nucleotide-binding universal stress UspA family protein